MNVDEIVQLLGVCRKNGRCARSMLLVFKYLQDMATLTVCCQLFFNMDYTNLNPPLVENQLGLSDQEFQNILNYLHHQVSSFFYR